MPPAAIHYDWGMKTSLDHLPEQKIHELKRAMATIRQFVEPQMIILFGSYARGDWVEDIDEDTLEFRYQSDFDILVVMETRQQASHVEQNERLSQALMKHAQRTPVSVIASDIGFINKRIRKSQYFYIDIKREGVMLYDTGNFTLDEAKELTAQERHHLAQEDFVYWMKSAKGFYAGMRFYMEYGDNSISAFQLHQATERFYSAMLLVFTRYKPNTHDLKKLSGRVASIEPEFLTVFPMGTEEERRLFKLLRQGYVDARYKPSYTITKAELEWLGERVEYLQSLTERLCKAKIASYLEK